MGARVIEGSLTAMKVTGKCHCGQITYEAEVESE
jgi:hypothetical protein